MRILGIETSCDETGIAIYDDVQGIMAHQLYSQIAVHADYGGVVPELASRDHVRKTIPLIKAVLEEANLTPQDLDGVAYTAGPGLVGALLVGCSIGRSLAYGWDLPAVPVHHMEGHLLAPMLEDDVPEEVKIQRANDIMEIQSQISWELNQAKIGQEFKVVIDRKEGNYFVGRTEFDSPDVDNEVLIDATKTYLKTGEFATIKVTEAEDFDLYGEVLVS